MVARATSSVSTRRVRLASRRLLLAQIFSCLRTTKPLYTKSGSWKETRISRDHCLSVVEFAGLANISVDVLEAKLRTSTLTTSGLRLSFVFP